MRNICSQFEVELAQLEQVEDKPELGPCQNSTESSLRVESEYRNRHIGHQSEVHHESRRVPHFAQDAFGTQGRDLKHDQLDQRGC